MIVLLALRGLFTPVWVTASTSRLRDLVPPDALGRFWSQRLALMTITLVVVGLAGSVFVRWWQSFAATGDEICAYSFLLIGGRAVFGLLGPSLVAASREPLMPPARETERSALSVIPEPLRDRNFRRLSGSW